MEFVLFICGLFTGFIIRSIFFSSKNSGRKSGEMEKSYLRKGLYTQKYQITQLGVKVSEIDVNFEVGEIEKTKNKSKVKVLDMVSSSAEYNNASSQRDKLKSMIENSWIESNEVEWIEDDLSEKREEKINKILNKS
jgi:hypothetical protein